MYNFFNKIVRLFCLCVFLFGHSSADAQNRNLPADINPYFGPVGKQPVMPNAAGFIQRWLLLEPISMPVKSNVVFTDSYLKEIFHTQYFPKQMETVPKDGAVVKVGKEKLKWHALDSKLFNVKLFRFATSFKKPKYGVLFWAVTVIDCPEEMKDVRLSVGSNGASMWWLNGEEAVMLEGDRRMVRDDVLTMWNKTLDPKSPDFKYTEPVVVASSLDDEDCDAIDAGLLLDPTTGRLWLSYGTYFGFIRLVELDPKTGKRMEGNEPVNIAIDCEATDLIYRNGWYYLLGTHGTCCDGPNSTYNIVVGRSRKITGPYVDNVGREMLQGGGKMVIAANNLKTGPGHFGRYIEEEGVEKMSFHYESDFRQGGRSVLAIRPLLWKNDWPVAGDEFHAGTYEIESERRGYALEIAVDFVRMQRDIEPFWIKPTKPLKNIEPQTLKEVEAEWPKGEVKVRMNDYMFRPHQKWSIMPAGKGGYLGDPYYKICIEGTTRYLTATAQHDVIAKPEFTGEDAQLWRIEQLTDGTYRIMPKAVPGTEEKLALVSLGDCTPGLAPFDFNSDNSKWNFRQQ